MKRYKRFFIGLALAVMILSVPLWSGVTGKIAGVVLDKETGDPLAGANVVVAGTGLGSAANLNGQYTILHVPPGLHELQVSVIGYAKVTVTDIRVRIDQTARVNVNMEMEALEGETVTVIAEKSIIKEDVATSVVAVTAQEVEVLPVANVQSVVGLQAGIQNGLEIRGGGTDEALLLLDGVTLRDPRNNKPVSSVALSAVQEISIERGGFNAEYGQVRSGIVNVITKEGSAKAHHGSVELRMSPPGKKHFGISPFDPNSFYLRPYYDDDVCWTGTDNGAWNLYMQRQYPDFEGWNEISENLMGDNNPDNDLSPAAAQRVFMWETRKQPDYNQTDYDIDGGLGGPVPLIGENLGDLRFFTSYRRHREMLVVPLTRDDYVDWDWNMKLISDLSPSMKLTISGLIGKQYTMQQNFTYQYLRYPSSIASVMGERLGDLFGTGSFSLADIGHKNIAAKLTHTLNSRTFYEVSLEHFIRDYDTRPPGVRDTTLYEVVPDYFHDEAPYGYSWEDEIGIVRDMVFGGFTCKRRDNTKARSTTLKADITSQMNFNNLMKAGVEFIYNDIDLDYGIIAYYKRDEYTEHVLMNVEPVRAAVYLQDKLETKGFIMNLGLRLDYTNSNTEWWDVDPYDPIFFGSKYDESLDFSRSESKPQWQLSPRLGISHPITENSKLFFNYGHFKQIPSYETLFRVGRSTDRRMTTYGDPNLILAKTISYELGYDHAIMDNYLVQLAAFYHDIFDQQSTTRYTAIGGIVYDRTTSNSYEDIRGFELTVRKNRGRWWTFFGNFTYQVSTSGHFGRSEVYEDPSRQKHYDETTTNLYQERPTPSPYARFNLSLFTPDDFGPLFSGIRPVGGWMGNLLLDWHAGNWVTWNPKEIASVANNVQETDMFSAILRLSKTFQFNKLRIQAFADIANLFNYRRMSLWNFGGSAGDRIYYYESLHLPKSDAYDNIPGNDRVGDYRKPGVDFQPIEIRGAIDYANDIGIEDVIYYDNASGLYLKYLNQKEAWIVVNEQEMNKILEDKAYIDMPNLTSFTFFDPRRVFFGLRISFDLQ
ncbi:TonB-dependent receptor [bacterium]|nr:TonB-dependent receptor [bacterium]RQV92384.1 MAG: TonB-dependent receptor [bacterium]